MRFSTFVALVASVVAALALASTSAAHPPCADTGMPGHSDYGRSHIASHGPHGHGVGGHNPGTHRGYSVCNPSGK